MFWYKSWLIRGEWAASPLRVYFNLCEVEAAELVGMCETPHACHSSLALPPLLSTQQLVSYSISSLEPFCPEAKFQPELQYQTYAYSQNALCYLMREDSLYPALGLGCDFANTLFLSLLPDGHICRFWYHDGSFIGWNHSTHSIVQSLHIPN